MAWFNSNLGTLKIFSFFRQEKSRPGVKTVQDKTISHKQSTDISAIINASVTELSGNNLTLAGRKAFQHFPDIKALIRAMEKNGSSDFIVNLKSVFEKLPWHKKWFFPPKGEEMVNLVITAKRLKDSSPKVASDPKPSQKNGPSMMVDMFDENYPVDSES